MDRQNETYFETEIYIDDDGLQTIMDRLIADKRQKMVWLTGGKVAILWNPTEANFVTTFPAPPPAPKMHISEILHVMISRMVEYRISYGREYALDLLSGEGDPKKREAARGWLIGEPVPARAYPRFIEMAIDLAGMGRPLDISMCERLRELAAEAERDS